MASGSGSRINDQNASDFKIFFDGWMVRQKHYLDELQSASENCRESLPDDLKKLITRVLSHYQQYYQRKSIAAEQDVFQVFSPSWLSSLEKSFLWIAGFKPALAFKIVANSITDLSTDQSLNMDQLATETKAEERNLADDMAKIQESVASPPLLKQVRVSGRTPVDGEIREVEVAIGVLKLAMESILTSADLLRTRTAAKVVDVLSPAQGVRFLTEATQLHLHIRSWGLHRDAQRNENEDD